ncbi:MAG: abortive phage resistance protein, partial [Candidatus Dadabacteria bacterium]|nr:abortive phage resistance protein [Candidatus Dadabacteria bacterium]
MNIKASIIDQHLEGVKDEIREQAGEDLNITEDRQLKSLAFVYLCVQRVLDLDHEEAFDCLTEGSGDFGVDAIHLTEEMDGEFGVSLFQCKYKDSLEGNFNFEENAVNSLINAVRYLFNPSAKLNSINNR